MDILIVVDMQNDFVSGALGSAEAQAIVPAVVQRAEQARQKGETILFTRDTHPQTYLEGREGRKLPVPHCIRGTPGWEIIDALNAYAADAAIVDKPTFGSTELGQVVTEMNANHAIEKITLIGLCTDICVISNALLLRAFLPEVEITVDAACCAGVTPQSHRTALEAMTACQIDVENF